MTKIMPIPKITQQKQGNVNNKMSLRKSNKMVAIDEKEHADRIAAAEAMSALSSMVILSSTSPVNERDTVQVVTRGTSPINIPSNVVKYINATEVIPTTSETMVCTRGIPETPRVEGRGIQMTAVRVSPVCATSNIDSHKQDNSCNVEQLKFGIVLIPSHIKNETSSHEKTLPLKKRALVREQEVHISQQECEKNEGTDHPIVVHLPSGTEMVSGDSQPRSQDLVLYQHVPVDPRLSLSALTELAIVWKADEDGDLPLHIAVVHENIKLVERFVHIMATVAGRSVDKFNKTQQTPLHLAVELNFKEAVRCLLHAGSNPNLVDKRGHSAIHLAVKNQFPECLAILLSEPKSKVELNSRNFEGFAPVHTAVCNKNISILKQLLDIGADIETVDGKSGRSALFHAVETNQMDIVEELQNRGANCDLPNYAGVTPLMAAQARNHHAVASVMLKGSESRLFGNMADNTSDHSSPPPSKVQTKGGERSQQRLMRTTSMTYSTRTLMSQAQHVIDLTVPAPVRTTTASYKVLQSDPSRIPSVVSSKLPQQLQVVNNEKIENVLPSGMHVKDILARQLQKQCNERRGISETPVVVPQPVYFQQLMQASMPRIPHVKHSKGNRNSTPEKMDTSDSNKDEKHVGRQAAKGIDSDLANDQNQEKIMNRLPEVSNVDYGKQSSSTMPRSPLLLRALKQETVESLDSTTEKHRLFAEENSETLVTETHMKNMPSQSDSLPDIHALIPEESRLKDQSEETRMNEHTIQYLVSLKHSDVSDIKSFPQDERDDLVMDI